MTREEKIKKGKIWHVYLTDNLDEILFEGSRTAAYKFLASKVSLKTWKKGKSGYSIGKLIWENNEAP